MNDYSKRKDMLWNQIVLYKSAIIVAIGELKFGSKDDTKLKQKIKELVSYVSCSKSIDDGKTYSVNQKYIEKVKSILNKHEQNLRFKRASRSSTDIEDDIKKRVGNCYRNNLDEYYDLSDKIYKYASAIESNPAKALVDFLAEYQRIVREYQNLLKLEELSKQPEKKNVENKEKQTQVVSNHSKEDISGLVDQQISQLRPSLKYSDVDALAKLYPGLQSYEISRYYEHLYKTKKLEDTISNYEKKGYNHSIHFMIEEIMNLGISVYNNLPEYLLKDNSQLDANSIQFIKKAGIPNSLEKYQELYEKFMRIYSKLPDDHRRIADNKFNQSAEYYFKSLNINMNMDRAFTAKDVIKPDALKNKVNQVIASEYEKSFNAQGLIFEDSKNVQMFINASKYMTEEEIVKIYKNIEKSFINYQTNDPEKEKSIQNNVKNLQKNVALVLASRTNLRNTSPEMNEQEKNKVMQEREAGLVGICRDYFKEEPKFETLFITPNSVQEGLGSSLVEGGKAIKNAELRYYGLSKLGRAMQKADLKKLEVLKNNGVPMTNTQINEVNNMFGR